MTNVRHPLWQLEHYMRNAAASLDVLAIEVSAHGATTEADRLRMIASDLRQRAGYLYEQKSAAT